MLQAQDLIQTRPPAHSSTECKADPYTSSHHDPQYRSYRQDSWEQVGAVSNGLKSNQTTNCRSSAENRPNPCGTAVSEGVNR